MLVFSDSCSEPRAQSSMGPVFDSRRLKHSVHGIWKCSTGLKRLFHVLYTTLPGCHIQPEPPSQMSSLELSKAPRIAKLAPPTVNPLL